MTKDSIFDIIALIGLIILVASLGACRRTTIDVPQAYLENCYSTHCNAGDRACDCLSESRACQNKLNAQIDTIRGLK